MQTIIYYADTCGHETYWHIACPVCGGTWRQTAFLDDSRNYPACTLAGCRHYPEADVRQAMSAAEQAFRRKETYVLHPEWKLYHNTFTGEYCDQ